VFDRVLTSPLVFGVLLVLWGSGGTITNLALSQVLDRMGARKVLLVMLSVLVVDMALVPWASGHLWSSILVVAVWGMAGWGIIGPQQYRLVSMSPAIAPVLLGLNTAATYLGTTAAGILGAVGIHMLGAHQLSFLSVGVFALGIVASEVAAIRIANDNIPRQATLWLQPAQS
jgi:predicted MFS family arabinose efflux permease